MSNPVPWTDEHYTHLAELVKSGWSYTECADDLKAKFGVNRTRGAIAGACHRLNLKIIRPPKAQTRLYKKLKREKPIEVVKVKRPELPPEEKATIFIGSGVPLENCTCCRWPYGDKPHQFCNAPIYRKSYCQVHYEAAYRDQ